jgi:hypothetical protein
MGRQSEHVGRVGDRGAFGWLLFAVATAMALLLLNVGSAYGQDAGTTSSDASNGSDGAANTATGDAGATGNSSGTDTGQGASVVGHNGSIIVVRQSNTVNNNGVAVANTGANSADGNQTDGDQTAANGQLSAGGGIANNDGSASNSSNGSADITTGDAVATGNESETNIHQEANVNAVGGLGAIVIVTQDAEVNNFGVGIANTGLNEATGNDIDGDQTAVNGQGSLAAGSIANNQGSASNSSSGQAGIDTGDAGATGNRSNTNVTQIANVNAGGSLGGIVLIRQRADVDNVGVAIANTGLNEATGNEHEGDAVAATAQLAGAGSINGPPGLEVASNDGTASNSSDGTARIRTGNAGAVGNHSKTHITQSANANIHGGGFAVTDQSADVNNFGVALANTGGNEAQGNEVDGDQIAVTPQLAVAAGLGGDGDDTAIAGNFGSASNRSRGTAEIGTGNASATGNKSETTINQSANSSISDGSGFIVPIQSANVNNVGVGIANSGLNEATGNETEGDMLAVTPQLGLALGGGDGDDVAVAGNFGQASNSTDGTARIRTGDATATGSDSKNWINQSSANYIGGGGGGGFIVPVQSATVNNLGLGVANTGLNEADGNETEDDMIAIPVGIAIAGAFGGGDDIATAGNFGEASNSTSGEARIDTGKADATGNKAETTVNQSSANYIGGGGGGFIVPVQTATVNNVGAGIANSGLNEAQGNETEDDMIAATGQLGLALGLGSGDDTVIAGNFGTASNKTSGTAEITTGDACAAGNNSTTYITQNAGSAIDGGNGFIVPVQTAAVNNVGAGIANSGLNEAQGNETEDEMIALTLQAALAAEVLGGDDLATASNDGVASNSTEGSASIHTGAANAEGNRSATGISQTSNAFLAGTGFVVPIQSAEVNNVGVAIANSGLNEAEGNETEDDMIAVTGQLALGVALGLLGDDTAIANNTGVSSNRTSGTAEITTGDACAAGNVAANVVNQNSNVFAPLATFVVTTQDAEINNLGFGVANSGLNEAQGNETEDDMIALGLQAALGVSLGLLGDNTAIANNTTSNSNSTDGSARIRTGNADATGNWATNGVSQEANVFAPTALNVTTQSAPINNLGVGLANTGLNEAEGNETDGDLLALDLQVALALGLGGSPGIANNAASSSNTSTGTADIATGNATATGNRASNLSCQATNGVCPDLAFPPLPEPLCPCKHKDEDVVTPTVPQPPVPPVPPVVPQVGEQLPVTGGPLAAQALLGLLLVALGATLRRRQRA